MITPYDCSQQNAAIATTSQNCDTPLAQEKAPLPDGEIRGMKTEPAAMPPDSTQSAYGTTPFELRGRTCAAVSFGAALVLILTWLVILTGDPSEFGLLLLFQPFISLGGTLFGIIAIVRGRDWLTRTMGVVGLVLNGAVLAYCGFFIYILARIFGVL